MKRFIYIFLMALFLLAASCGKADKTSTVNDNTITEETGISATLPKTETSTSSVTEKEDSPISADEGNSSASNAVSETSDKEHYLEVHFIDVGQGDSTLIICDGEAMIIDAGGNTKGTSVQLYLTKQKIKTLKYAVGTHPDTDHIGGLDVISYKFDIDSKTVWMPGAINDSPAYYELLDAADERGYSLECPETGSQYSLGSSVITVLSPVYETDDINDNSIVLKVEMGETSFLFMGDAGSMVEYALLGNPIIRSDVIKIGHHGSRYSSSQPFIEAVAPSFAVISCGTGNDYGHPTRECLDILKDADISVFRTDEQGSIVAYSDGRTITWNTEPSITWAAGLKEEVAENTNTDGEITTVILPDTPDGETSDRPSESESEKETETETETPGDDSAEKTETEAVCTYVVNVNTNVFHKPDCDSVKKMKEKNKLKVDLTLEELLEAGIRPCGVCKPDQIE